jgi:CheY-like chemotaxis protein
MYESSLPLQLPGFVKMKMKKSILLIDDEYDLCDLITMVLNKEGFNVECAHTLAEASEKLQVHPDFVFLDNNMPDDRPGLPPNAPGWIL